MPVEVRWTRHAISRLTDIADYIAERDPAAAARLAERIFDATQLLAENPLLAPSLFEDRDSPTRRLVVGNHLVIYRVQPDQRSVWVLTVRHGREVPLEPEELGSRGTGKGQGARGKGQGARARGKGQGSDQVRT